MAKVAFLVMTGFFALRAQAVTAQTTVGEPQTVKLEVVLLRPQGDPKADGQRFNFRLGIDQKASMRIIAAPAETIQSSNLAPCDPSVFQQEYSQVERTVSGSANGDGRFSVTLVFTDRARAGCRVVDGVSIPVYSNRIIESVVRLGDGESADIELGPPSTGESTKVTVTLNLLKNVR